VVAQSLNPLSQLLNVNNMGQWYKATFRPTKETDRLLTILRFLCNKEHSWWECSIRYSDNFIWITGNECLQAELPDLIEPIEETLFTKLDWSIRLQDDLDVNISNAQFNTLKSLTASFTVDEVETTIDSLLAGYETRFGDRPEYLEDFLLWLDEKYEQDPAKYWHVTIKGDNVFLKRHKAVRF
jgi:hypothetical protein